MLSVRRRRDRVRPTLMAPSNSKPGSVDEYIASFEPEMRAILQKVRATVRAAAPGATEVISYRMPHSSSTVSSCTLRPSRATSASTHPSEEAPNWSRSVCVRGREGHLRFPLDKPIPYKLIGALTKLRAKQDAANAAAKRQAARGDPPARAAPRPRHENARQRTWKRLGSSDLTIKTARLVK